LANINRFICAEEEDLSRQYAFAPHLIVHTHPTYSLALCGLLHHPPILLVLRCLESREASLPISSVMMTVPLSFTSCTKLVTLVLYGMARAYSKRTHHGALFVHRYSVRVRDSLLWVTPLVYPPRSECVYPPLLSSLDFPAT